MTISSPIPTKLSAPRAVVADVTWVPASRGAEALRSTGLLRRVASQSPASWLRCPWEPWPRHRRIASSQDAGAPVAGAAELKKLDATREFHDYDFGDFVIYSGAPTFIDRRAELFGEKFFVDGSAASGLMEKPAPPGG
jgi:hypothetical protein